MAKRLTGHIIANSTESYFGQRYKAEVSEIDFASSVRRGHILIAREHLQNGGAEVTAEHLMAAAHVSMSTPMAALLLAHKPSLAAEAQEAMLVAIERLECPTGWLKLVMNHEGNNLDRRTVLHAAAKAGRFEAFKYVFKDGTDDYDQRDSDGRSLFECAALAGSLPLVEELLAKGCDRASPPAAAPLLAEVINKSVNYAWRWSGGHDYLDVDLSPAHIAVAKRLLKLDWPKSHLDVAFVRAQKTYDVLSDPNEYVTDRQKQPVLEFIATLQSRGATLPPTAPARKPRRLFGRR